MIWDPSLRLSRLTLAANSVADDLGFVALADLSRVLIAAGSLDQTRIIGGHMVMLHVQRWGLGRDLYRESQDADLGIAPITVKDGKVITALLEAGYVREAGNRFIRHMTDIPVRLQADKTPDTNAAIDILTPVYTSRPRQNVRISDELTTTEVPGLAIALGRPGIELELALRRLGGEELNVRIVVPDKVSAVVLKALAWHQRSAAKDAVDVWRTLEVGFAAGFDVRELQRLMVWYSSCSQRRHRECGRRGHESVGCAGSLNKSMTRDRHTASGR